MAKQNGKSILVVDDESVVRDLISGFLTKLGYAVHVAEDGKTAEILFRSLEPRPVVMVTDIVMPEMDGPTLAAALRETHPGLCVLFVSSYPSKKLSEKDLDHPTNGYLSKPFSFRSFATAVGKLARAAQAPAS
jgi:two-component system cell cycle sensor histidine kinase/response regulator CckA